MKIPTLSNRTNASLALTAALCFWAAAPSSHAEPAATAPAAPSTLTAHEKKFVEEAGAGNAAEVAGGEMAQKKSTNPDIQAFGKQMVTDHGKANEDLAPIAQKAGVAWPPQPTAKQKATAERLEKLSGAAFDKAYIADMVRDHTEDEAKYKEAVEMIKDTDLKTYATTTLAVVQHHLMMAKEDKSKMMSAAK